MFRLEDFSEKSNTERAMSEATFWTEQTACHVNNDHINLPECPLANLRELLILGDVITEGKVEIVDFRH